jgi:hypothetical protein
MTPSGTAVRGAVEPVSRMSTILEAVRRAAGKRILYLPPAVKQMARPERLISPAEVEHVAMKGELIEDYPDDARGHSCLLLSIPRGRPIHVVCSPRSEYLAIITAYVPDPRQWSPDFRRRIE